MGDLYSGFVVALDKDVHPEAMADTINAIRQIKGVIDVVEVVGKAETHIAQARAETAIEGRLWAALYPAKDRS